MAGITALLALVSMPATAEVAAEDMARVRNQLLQGNAHNAIELLQDMQVDAPDSPYVQFGLGEAFSLAAEQAREAGDLTEAVGLLESARRAFDAAATGPGPDTLHANAHYNAANAMTRMGQLLARAEQYHGAVQQLHGALETYDIALSRDADHLDARHNRAYARWALKQLLMEEPPPEEQPQPQPEGEEDEDQEGEDEQEEQQPEGEEEQPQEPEGDEEQPDDTEGEDEREPGEEPQPQPPSPEDHSDLPDEPQDMGMQEFEALLDNLKDIDDEEQRNMRREERAQQQIREWW